MVALRNMRVQLKKSRKRKLSVNEENDKDHAEILLCILKNLLTKKIL